MRNTHRVRASLPEPESTEAVLGRLLPLLPFCSLRTVVRVYCEPLAFEQNRLTLAAPRCWLGVLAERRELLERAASRAMGGRPMVVHLIATDASEPAGGGQ